MKTGVELIANERQEQIQKHNRTMAEDVMYNGDRQLADAACKLIWLDTEPDIVDYVHSSPPDGWNEQYWRKVTAKAYIDRLIIAGALIAAEIDRITNKTKEDDRK